jgi:hypothetical protein
MGLRSNGPAGESQGLRLRDQFQSGQGLNRFLIRGLSDCFHLLSGSCAPLTCRANPQAQHEGELHQCFLSGPRIQEADLPR